ncbi:hypothetical protein NE236_42985 [Actinoallomurus purpureus]|uniref:hypothetical protein n=1 Tax=Actinoallomurus purpureus TaxID=478114 RepID=UPI002092246A|nr:hypothetical protein [Actinoallomurus purpureus]MCO6011733.1 hypothetical protein [Actinoallomurus purpureus]
MARQRHDMTGIRWFLLAVGTLALVAGELVTSDLTLRFTWGMAYGYGVIILGIAEWIIARTRNHPQVREANAPLGIDK